MMLISSSVSPTETVVDGHTNDAVSDGGEKRGHLQQEKIQLKRHEKYFIDLIHLQVEDYLFAVPRQVLTHDASGEATFFSNRDACPTELGGNSESNPIFLEEVNKQAFECFLDVIDPLNTGVPAKLSTDMWISVLKLANTWRFQSVHEKAKAEIELQDLSAVRKIDLGLECHVPLWVEDGCLELIKRPKSLTIEEALCLGIESVVQIAELRDEYPSMRQNAFAPMVGGTSGIGLDTGGEHNSEEKRRELRVRNSICVAFSLPETTPRGDEPLTREGSPVHGDRVLQGESPAKSPAQTETLAGKTSAKSGVTMLQVPSSSAVVVAVKETKAAVKKVEVKKKAEEKKKTEKKKAEKKKEKKKSKGGEKKENKKKKQ